MCVCVFVHIYTHKICIIYTYNLYINIYMVDTYHSQQQQSVGKLIYIYFFFSLSHFTLLQGLIFCQILHPSEGKLHQPNQVQPTLFSLNQSANIRGHLHSGTVGLPVRMLGHSPASLGILEPEKPRQSSGFELCFQFY